MSNLLFVKDKICLKLEGSEEVEMGFLQESVSYLVFVKDLFIWCQNLLGI